MLHAESANEGDLHRHEQSLGETAGDNYSEFAADSWFMTKLEETVMAKKEERVNLQPVCRRKQREAKWSGRTMDDVEKRNCRQLAAGKELKGKRHILRRC